jgi:uncharacterized protein YuzB (UPF0349 family)
MSNTMAGAKNVFKENGKNEQLTIFEWKSCKLCVTHLSICIKSLLNLVNTLHGKIFFILNIKNTCSYIHITCSLKMPDHMTGEFVKSTELPPNSPDSNLLDYNA